MTINHAFMIVLGVLIFCGCSKEVEETTPNKGYSDDIIGEWEWISSWSPWGNQTTTPASCTCWVSLTFTSDSVVTNSDQPFPKMGIWRRYRIVRTYDNITKDSVDGIIYDSNLYADSYYIIRRDTLSITLLGTDPSSSTFIRK